MSTKDHGFRAKVDQQDSGPGGPGSQTEDGFDRDVHGEPDAAE